MLYFCLAHYFPFSLTTFVSPSLFRSGMFVVGPESAGAHPGPACYRKGNRYCPYTLICLGETHASGCLCNWKERFPAVHLTEKVKINLILKPDCLVFPGGPLTVTDANLALGRLLPSFFPKIFGPGENEPLSLDETMRHFHQLTQEINLFLSSKHTKALDFPFFFYFITKM